MLLPCTKHRAAQEQKQGISQRRTATTSSSASHERRNRRTRVFLYCFVFLLLIITFLQQGGSPSGDYSTVQLGYESLLLGVSSSTTSNSTLIVAAVEEGGVLDDEIKKKQAQKGGNHIVESSGGGNTQSNMVRKNLRVVFVGDSLSRYMYLSLVYYLKHDGREWAPRGHKLLEKVKDSSPDAWNEWLAFTNQQLGPEECDCYRYWTHPFQWYKHCENRYYHDDNNNYVSFLTKFGGNPFHGHVLADQVFRRGRDGMMMINQTVRPYDWVYPTWDRLVEEYIAHWKPKPDLFVFNQGHWKAHELRDEKVLKKLRRVLKKHGIRGIYRTTTFRQDERVVNEKDDQEEEEIMAASYQAYRNAATRKHDALVCQYFECLNVSWTAGIPTTEYVDPVHFTAPINNRMNQQFLNEFVFSHSKSRSSNKS